MHYKLYNIKRIYGFYSCIQKSDLSNNLGEYYSSHL
jgi:hypothetical protein